MLLETTFTQDFEDTKVGGYYSAMATDTRRFWLVVLYVETSATRKLSLGCSEDFEGDGNFFQ